MPDDNKYTLSRRKALLGLGTIGVAGAGAGVGTSALFSDEEEFNENQITAGTLDMAVTAEVVATNEYWESEGILGNPVTADGDVVQKFQLDDVKPGDWAIICFTVDSVGDNPFYLTIHGDADEYAEKEGQNSEPENQEELGQPNQGNTTETVDNGFESVTATNAELGDKLLAMVWGSWDGTAPSQGTQSGGKSDLSGLSNDTNLGTSGNLPNFSYQEPDEDGNVSGNSDVNYTDVREWYFGEDQDPNNPQSNIVSGSGINNGIASGDGILVGSPAEVGSTDYDPASSLLTDPDDDDEGELVFYLLLELPSEVGNEIQGDAVKGNLRFNAEQVRNNDDPRSGRNSSSP